MSSSLRATGEGLVWLIGAVVCLYAAPRVQLFVSVAMDGCVIRHGIVGGDRREHVTPLLRDIGFEQDSGLHSYCAY